MANALPHLGRGTAEFWQYCCMHLKAPCLFIHTCRLGFQVDAAAKATVQFGLELTHLLAQLAEFLLEASHFVVDFVHGGGQAFLHIGQW